jgi:Uma2 family endonuclease
MIVSKPLTTEDVATAEHAEHIVLGGVSWEDYEHLLDMIADRRLRHSYDDGVLEIMSPLKGHDRAKKALARLIESMALELDIEIQPIGSTTLRRRERRKGLEPDECYYVQHEAEVRDKADYVPGRDPPPDLAVEVDVTSSSLDRMPIYADLGIPEVWRFRDEQLVFYRLTNRGKYVRMDRSRAFPILTPDVLNDLLRQRFERSDNQLVRALLAWLRAQAGRRRRGR